MKNNKQPLMVYLTAAERKKLERLAADEHLSLSAMVCKLVRSKKYKRFEANGR